MSFDHFIPNHGQQVVRKQYQPLYPLQVDGAFGLYSPVDSLEDSIQKDFEFLLKTIPGEWPNNPDLGVGLERFLFSNYREPGLEFKIQQTIQNQLNKYLPFPNIQLISVKIVATPEDEDSSFATLNIKYSILANLVRMLDVTSGNKIVNVNVGRDPTASDLASLGQSRGLVGNLFPSNISGD